MNEVRDPCSASSDCAHATSAACARRRARTSPSAQYAAMNCVPLMSERPSFAASFTGSSPTRVSASRPGMRSPSKNASPSPTSGSARCASGARSPDAPTLPRAGTTGTIPLSRHASTSSTVSTRAPEFPFASVLARSSIAARTISSGYGSPTPHACERSRRSWSSSVSSSGIDCDTKRPNPVLTPYVCSLVPCAARSTTSRAARIFSRAASVSSVGRRSTATAQTSATVRSSPVSATGGTGGIYFARRASSSSTSERSTSVAASST